MDNESAVLRQSPKRSLNQVEEISSPKRQKRTYHHHHALQYKPQPNPSPEPALLGSESVDKLLVEAIKDVLEEQALRLDIQDPVIESLALESLRNAVDECEQSDSSDHTSANHPRRHEYLL